jgi:cell division septum initiation protein DivIVA
MMTSVNTEPMTPDFVRSATFTPARLGRRGLDEAQVHDFCQWVADDLARVLSENAMLHEEVVRLRERVLDRNGGDPGIRPEDGQVQAVYVLSKAQQTADRYVADAQEYSRAIAARSPLPSGRNSRPRSPTCGRSATCAARTCARTWSR